MAEPREGPLTASKLDSPPPLPPRLSDPKAPDLARLSGQPTGTKPTGDMAQIVIEHGMLAENLLVSLARMLPSFAPISTQIITTLRAGIVQALQQASTPQGAQANLAAGAGPAPPVPPPPQVGAGAGPAGPASAAVPQQAGTGPIQ